MLATHFCYKFRGAVSMGEFVEEKGQNRRQTL